MLLLAGTVACGSDSTGGGTAGAAAIGGGAGSGVMSAGSMNGGAMTGGGMGGGAGAPSAGSGSSGASGSGGSGGAVTTSCVAKSGQEPSPLLSKTGCVDMAQPSKAAPGLIPYSVRSPLWSDGAVKHRFMSIPPGSKIKVLDCSTQAADCASDAVNGDDGHWLLPTGSVLVKSFSIENKLVETRLILHPTETEWFFYGYEWNDAGTEATLLPDDNIGKETQVGGGTQVWSFPGRGQCPQCHTPGAGFSLGPSTPQMSSDFMYAEGMMNQVEKFVQLGLLEAPAKPLTGLPDPADSAVPLEERALSYIHTNCAICHRPSGEYSGMDMRWSTAHQKTAIAGMQLCQQAERDMGKNGLPKYRVVPGQPMKSGMSFRMHALDELRMPKIGSKVVDPVGAKLIDDWITAMPTNACPEQTP